MHTFVTGAAGFIGSNLVDRLLKSGHTVVGFDDLSTGREEFLSAARGNAGFRLERGDLLDGRQLQRAMQGCDFVFHLAANADVRFGLQRTRKDLDQNVIVTWNVLEAMRANQVDRIAFTSTGSIYGECKVIPTPEDAPFPIQTSLYGASKLAAEGLIAAYCEGFGMRAYIFRLVSIMGERYTHGHVLDFYQQLLRHPGYLEVLGDGRQKKSYLYVHDCIDAMLLALKTADSRVNILNLGVDEYTEVNDSIRWITGHLGLNPEIRYGGGDRGWVGDTPLIYLDCTRMRRLGWAPSFGIRECVIRTLQFLQENTWVFRDEKSQVRSAEVV